MDWSQASDAELLTATGTNVDAFAAFDDRYETAVVGYLLKRTRDIELALDLAAEVFAAALAGARRYRSQRDCAAPWLFTIAHSKLADSVRRGRVEARARQRLGIRDRIEYGEDELYLDRVDRLPIRVGHRPAPAAAHRSTGGHPSPDRRRALL